MSDLVERLQFNASAGIPDFTNSKLLDEAAARIEALEAALRHIIAHSIDWMDVEDTARAALDKDVKNGQA